MRSTLEEAQLNRIVTIRIIRFCVIENDRYVVQNKDFERTLTLLTLLNYFGVTR